MEGVIVFGKMENLCGIMIRVFYSIWDWKDWVFWDSFVSINVNFGIIFVMLRIIEGFEIVEFYIVYCWK